MSGFFIATPQAFAAARTSNGTGGGNSNIGASWAGGVAPSTGDTIQILNGDTITMAGAVVSFGGIQVDNGGVLALGSIGITDTGTGTGVNGFTINGSITGTGTILINGVGATIDGTGSVGTSGTVTLTNAKTIASTATNLRFSGALTVTTGSAITQNASSNVTVTGTVTITSTGAWTNNGTFTASGTFTGTGNWTQNNGSTLNLGGSAANANALSGTFSASTNANTVNYNLNGAQTCKVVIYYNLILSGGGAKTCAVTTITNLTVNNGAGTTTWTGTSNPTISGALSIGASTTYTVGAYTLAVTGTTTISGTLTVNSTTGTKTFGNIVINTGGLLNFSANEAVAINGNLQIDGTGSITSGTGTWTFQKSGGSGTISGTITSVSITNPTFTTTYTNSIATLTVGTLTPTAVVTNNGTITVITSLAAGSFTNGTNATLNLNFTGAPAVTTLTATASGNTVNYGFGGTQTVKGTTYSNLTLSVSGAKTMTGVTTINGNLTLSGTASATAASSMTIGGNISIGTGTTFNGGTGLSHSVAGNWSNSGTFTAGTGTVNFNGTTAILGSSTNSFNNVTVSGSLTAPSGNMNVAGNWTNNGGAFTVGSGTVTFNGAGAQIISGTVASQTFNNVIINKSANTLSVSGSTTTLTVNDLTETAGGFTPPATLNINGNFVHTAGTFTAGANVNIKGNWTRNGGTFSLSANIVTFNGATQAIGGSTATTFSTLTIANGSITTGNTNPSTTNFNVNNGGKYIHNVAAALPSGTRTFGVTSTIEYQQNTANACPVSASYGNLIINVSNFSAPINCTGNLTSIAGDFEVKNTNGQQLSLVTNTSLTHTISGNLIVDGGTLVLSNGTGAPIVNVAGNVILNGGIFQPMTGSGVPTINVFGNWSNSGTFTSGTGTTVTLNGTNQTISGSTTFYNLTKSVSIADTLTFTAGTTQTISHTLTLNGASGNLLSLRSSSTGNQWNIDPQTIRTLSYLDVKDSNNTNTTAIATNGLNITNSGNNTNWNFPQYTLTYTAGDNGTITGTSPQTVDQCADGSEVTALANEGYYFTSWDDGVLTASRTDTNVLADITVTANFEADAPVIHTLTYSAGANGHIEGETPQTVNDGDSGTEVSAVADPGFHFLNWDDASTDNPRTDLNVQGDISATASFEANLASDKNIIDFSFPQGSGVISGTDIAVTVPFGTNVTALVPTIVLSGGTVSPLSGVAQDFTGPVTYTVTATDETFQVYMVTVSFVAPSTIATVTSLTYTISNSGTANETITNVSFGISRTTFLAALTKGQVDQTWDDSAIADPVVTDNTLVVTAQDGVTTVTYTVTINAAPLSTTKAITAFSFSSGTGVINESSHTITVNVPNGTDVTALVATFTTTGAGVSISEISQVSATTADDFTTSKTYRVTAANGTAQDYIVTVTILEATQISPDNSGAATVDSTTPQVVITNPTQAVDVTIESGTTNPTIDVSSFITGGTGTLPEINITSANANVTIPASTVVTSADITWNGIIAAPTVTTVTLPETSGETKTLSTAIEVGFTGAKLSFDKAVRILLPGQAGKRAGYIRTGIDFTEITSTCIADNQATGNALVVDGDCKIDVGSDLVIWTKHFTTFATYTQTTVSPAPATGGGGASAYSLLSADVQRVDANKDGKIDVLDFNILMVNWGETEGGLGDFNSDGIVDIFDFELLMVNWMA